MDVRTNVRNSSKGCLRNLPLLFFALPIYENTVQQKLRLVSLHAIDFHQSSNMPNAAFKLQQVSRSCSNLCHSFWSQMLTVVWPTFLVPPLQVVLINLLTPSVP